MTFGIDISTYQSGLDLSAAKAAGAEFVIVKSVANYLPELTVADHYQDGIDRTIAAGLGHAKGHYAIPNSQNTPEVTADFQMGVVHRWEFSDVFMLDNEPLGKYAVYWRDDDAAAYFYRLHSHGVEFSQMWLYCPAYLARANGPWPRIEALRKLGLRIVWVSYGDNDPFREDGEEPLLGGGITGWDVHQFTSTWRVPGYPGDIDGNYSPHTVGELFGGGERVTLEQKAREFARRYPTSGSHPNGGDNDWDQDCGRVCYRFASFLGWASRPDESRVYSAYAVAMASGRLNTNAAAAPIGAWHFWDIAGPSNGHVGVDLTGGGRRVFMGTWSVAEDWGRAIGVLSVGGYTAAKAGRARYLGWATNYAGGTVDLAVVAGVAVKPVVEIEPWREDDMSVIGLENVRGDASKGLISYTAGIGKLVAHPYIKSRENTANAVSEMGLYATEQKAIRLMRDYDFIAFLVGIGFADVPRMETPTDNVGAQKMRDWLPKPGQTLERTQAGTVRY